MVWEQGERSPAVIAVAWGLKDDLFAVLLVPVDLTMLCLASWFQYMTRLLSILLISVTDLCVPGMWEPLWGWPSAHTQATSLAVETVFRVSSCCHFGCCAVPNAELLRRVCDGLSLCPGKQSINNGSSDAPKPMWVLLLLTDLSVPEIGTLSGEEGSRSLISDTLSLSSSCHLF